MNNTTYLPARFENLQLTLISADPDQVRKHFDEEALTQLAESIKTHGLVQPIVVKPTANGQHQIIAGERRYRAALLAGMTDIPTIVREDLANTDSSVIQVIENLQRVDLTLSETVAGVGKLVQQIGFAKTCEQLAKSPAWVSKHSSVAKLHPTIRDAVANGRLTDIEVAHDLNKLHELDEAQAEDWLLTLAASDEEFEDADLPTRERVRNELQWAKKQVEQDAEREKELTASKAEQSTPDAKKKQAEEKQKEKAKAAKGKEIEQLHKQCEALADSVLTVFCNSVNAPIPSKSSYGARTLGMINVSAEYFGPYIRKTVPESVDAANFHVRTNELPVMQMKKLASALGNPAINIDVDIADLTIDEAIELQKLLGKKISFRCALDADGAQLIAAQAKLTGKASSKPSTDKSKKPDVKISTFIKACIVKGTVSDRLPAQNAYTAYLRWAKKQGVDLANGPCAESFKKEFVEAKIAHNKVAGITNFLAVTLKAGV